MLDRCEIEEHEKWREWAWKIPSLHFPNDWKITIIPPFAGAMVRFVVERGVKEVSVYLDCYEKLGFFGEPYWELYPDKNGDNYRVPMADTTELIHRIQESLDA